MMCDEFEVVKVVIRGKYPDCEDCRFLDEVQGYCYCNCETPNYTLRKRGGYRPPWCPLVLEKENED